MARVLSPNLIGASVIAGGRRLLGVRLLSVRRYSGWSERAQLVELEFDGDVDAGVRLIDEAIQSIIIRRAAPDWLPFVPGASYWVPPRKTNFHGGSAYAAGGLGLVELVGKLTNPRTKEEALSFTTSRGWPSSAYFVGGMSQQLKGPQETDVESDDES